MRLFLLTAVTMVAFAANSILTRLGVHGYGMDPVDFAAIRTAAGAVMLFVLVLVRQRGTQWRPGVVGPMALAAYMLGFSLSYTRLDAGLGALILFGGVQITMFAASLLGGEPVSGRKWTGAGLAMVGLALLFLPGGEAAVSPVGAALMAVAAVGWGIYSLIGRGSAEPLADTALNFAICLPVVAVSALMWRGSGAEIGGAGVLVAILSGAVTSGVGYGMWYSILPRLQTTTAAVAQLSVPVIAIALGAVTLGEEVTGTTVLAAAIVLGGIGLSLTGQRKIGSSAS